VTIPDRWLTKESWDLSHLYYGDSAPIHAAGRTVVRSACALVTTEDGLRPEPVGLPTEVDLVKHCWRCEQHTS
jgi:hypothetical protein